MPNKSNSCLLARVNFPLYSVQMLTNRHLSVAGGGGAAKTGVKNGFEVYELSFDGSKFIANRIIRYETGTSVVMNFAARSTTRETYIVAGQEGYCQLYDVPYYVLEDGIVKEDGSSEHEVRNRFTSKKQEKRDKNSVPKILTLDIIPSKSVQTDFDSEEPFQKVVRVSSSGKLMVTGGADGHLRIWAFPSFRRLIDIEAHTQEIDDVDFSLDEKQVVSISKDGDAILWNSETGAKLHKLQWKLENGTKYLYKRCRYAPDENRKGASCLYTLSNPIGKTKKPSYIQKWDAETSRLMKQVEYNENLSALAVRNDGRFVAIGTMFTGSVVIYIAFSLQKILTINRAHNMFITGLQFIPVSTCLKDSLTTLSEAAVVSISVDNKICIHNIPHRGTLSVWTAVGFIVFTLCSVFSACSYIGL